MRRVEHLRAAEVAVEERRLLHDVSQLVGEDRPALGRRRVGRSILRDDVPAERERRRADRRGRLARLRAGVHADVREIVPEAPLGVAADTRIERLPRRA